ncbi:MAG: type II toxin-antitoxin system RelE/ParE family toxin [Ignavibacteria bacterium]
MIMYQIEIVKSAIKTLKSIPPSQREKIAKSINDLAFNPRPPGCKKLKGYEKYRIKISDYRVIYEIEDTVLIILIIKIGHRKDIYRNL